MSSYPEPSETPRRRNFQTPRERQAPLERDQETQRAGMDTDKRELINAQSAGVTLIGNLDISEQDPTQASISSDTGGTQTIEDFIRDVVDHKESKSK